MAAGDRVAVPPVAGKRRNHRARRAATTASLSRATRGRQHVLVANVDQLLIVGSAAEPYLKPNLIDRFLVSAEKNKIRPLIVINKVDLVDRATLQPIVGVYSQMGYRVLLVSARRASASIGCAAPWPGARPRSPGRAASASRRCLNAVEPGFGLRVADVSEETQKGRHTTTTARLVAAGRRRLRHRHAGHSPVSIVGRGA